MKKILRIGMAIALIFIMFTSTSTMVFASVGQHLPNNQAGWTRFDDTDSALHYVGRWGHDTYPSTNQLYKKTESSTIKAGDYLTFKYYGSKLRIITSMQNNLITDAIISVDGVQETFNQYSVSAKTCIVAYEKLDLPLGIHTVTITKPSDTGYLEIDAIDIDGHLIPYDTTNLIATADDIERSITLKWDSVIDATNYIIKRSEAQGGPYTPLKVDVTDTTYVDQTVSSNTIYYYIVIPVINEIEGTQSNEASAIIRLEQIGRTLLTITYTNGFTRTYDLQISQLNDFIDSYESFISRSGKSHYKFDKVPTSGNFIKRTEYILFNNISNFDVDEYN